jgi:glutamine cyclotransferase
LNSRVIKTYKLDIDSFTRVEEVLNSKVNTTPCVSGSLQEKVDEVLNSRVLRTQVALHSTSVMAEGVLNCGDSAPTIGEGLNHKVSQAKEGELFDETIVDTVRSPFGRGNPQPLF